MTRAKQEHGLERPLRIVLLSAAVYPETVGGIEVHVHSLARALGARGHSVVVALPTAAPEREGDEVVAGLRVHRYLVPADATRAEFLLECPPRGHERVVEWLGTWRPDVVHAHATSTAVSLFHLEAGRRAGACTVQTLHNGVFSCVRARGSGAPPMLRWGRTECDGMLRPTRCTACRHHAGGMPQPIAYPVAMVQRAVDVVIPHADAILGARLGMPATVQRQLRWLHRLHATADWLVVPAEWQREALLRNGLAPARVRHVPHGASAPSGPRRVSDGTVRFGWAGRPTREKGLGLLLQAFTRMTDPRARLRVAAAPASTDETAALAALRGRFGDDPRISWNHAYDWADSSVFYQGLDVLVAPYAMEVGPLVALEALAHGVPVIGSAVGGIRELVRDGVNGRLVPHGNADALFRAMGEALDEPTRSRWAAGSTARRRPEDVTDDLLTLYRQRPGAQGAGTMPAIRDVVRR